jgi:DNA-binding NarL/FixJ family response regulator
VPEISSPAVHSAVKSGFAKNPGRKRRCLVADSHALIREAFCRLLESQPDFEVIGEAQSVDETLAQVATMKPDVVVLDLALPGDLAQAVCLMRAQAPDISIVLLATDDDPSLHPCLDAGASGYASKEAPAGVLFAEVRGGSWSTTDSAVSQTSRTGLTPRELDVMRLVAEGNPVKEVASTLGISTKTVETHKFNLMRKLNLRNTAQIVAYAIHNHISVRGMAHRYPR